MSGEANKPTKDDFHRERSRFLDAFAALEEALLPKTEVTKEKPLVDELKSLRAIRNDLVHSQLRFIQMEGELQAIAINVQNASAMARECRALRLEDFKSLIKKIEQTTNGLAA